MYDITVQYMFFFSFHTLIRLQVLKTGRKMSTVIGIKLLIKDFQYKSDTNNNNEQ